MIVPPMSLDIGGDVSPCPRGIESRPWALGLRHSTFSGGVNVRSDSYTAMQAAGGSHASVRRIALYSGSHQTDDLMDLGVLFCRQQSVGVD